MFLQQLAYLSAVVGEKVTEFNDRNGVKAHVFDLKAENDMLLVPSFYEHSVSCYELKYWVYLLLCNDKKYKTCNHKHWIML